MSTTFIPTVNYCDQIINGFVPFLNLFDQPSYTYGTIW